MSRSPESPPRSPDRSRGVAELSRSSSLEEGGEHTVSFEEGEEEWSEGRTTEVRESSTVEGEEVHNVHG